MDLNKLVVVSLLLIVALISCKNLPKEKIKEPSQLEIAKQYYKALDKSDVSIMAPLLGDSILIRENEDDYEERYSKKGYTIWLEWDGVFEPTYTILEIEEDDQVVKTKISKIDKRLSFLNQEPMVWFEILGFENDKIVKVERIKYEVFNVEKFVKNRDGLVRWIAENHPELNGFLFPQIQAVGMKYLKAIELYEQEK